ncbi:DUF2971 domain-containing protein [Rhizobium sp. 1399]|uniref:DUF2971 domain-containing protein n=1 Tax=Rhizobium sp. 1399 TaxID=2817758 RepID=UPI00286262A9|nr:DUF2971 domain-containing protein [Rhizobium sp. 1399]MDR6664276.1 hypothetical protein [Rhizobium sp. 1399]
MSDDEIGPEGLEQQESEPLDPSTAFKNFYKPVVERIFDETKIPDSLFHYTSAAGLLGILGQHKLWFSDAAFMNDGSEALHGLRVMSHVIDEFMKDQPDEFKEAADRLKTEVSDAMRKFQPLIFCMSARDNLLNQWRDYGKDVVPYCIEFQAPALQQWSDFTFPVFLTKIVYDVEFQQSLTLQLVEAIFKRALEIKGERQHFEEEEAAQLIRGAALEIVALITRFKNPAFEAEEEWRLVTFRSEIVPQVTRKFRTSSLGVVPYYEWEKVRNPKMLPVKGVTVGPSPYAQVSDLALKQFLDDQGYEAETYYSTIPIRR